MTVKASNPVAERIIQPDGTGRPHNWGRVGQWWKHTPVYQIYPASFCDANGDGMGDLKGVYNKLDYLHSLGIEMIWICPVYDSPQVDMGYDISDYENIYPPYGTVEDVEAIVNRAHTLGIRVIMDLVINHTSDQHAWFKESRSSKDNDKRDWYMWRPAKYSPTGERLPPNNWRSNFGGGSTWAWDEATQEYYLHLFTKEQPDLNWENPKMRKAIYQSAMVFWLEKGIDGFRVDTVNMYSKPVDLPDAAIIDKNSFYQPAAHLYCNGPHMQEYLTEMNAILSHYSAVSVGELPLTPELSHVLSYVSAKAKQLDMVFQFDVVDLGMGTTHRYETTPRNWQLPQLKSAIQGNQDVIRGTDAWTTVFLENHDQSRSVSRFGNDSPEFRVPSARMLALMQACLSGTLFIYQGQEIGCVNAPLESYPIEYYKDVDSNLFIEKVRTQLSEDRAGDMKRALRAVQHLARDHARIPMAWQNSNNEKTWGFSPQCQTPEKPWMEPHPLGGEINVLSEKNRQPSVLNFWRRMLRFRKEYPEFLVEGEYQTLDISNPDVYTFTKKAKQGNDTALVVLNFTQHEQQWKPPTAQEIEWPGDTTIEFEPLMSTLWRPSEEDTYRGDCQPSSEPLCPYEGRVYVVKSSL
ncbi:hypothetical protein S40285_08521 [Stachybotrys chlorohalonatus IBT 40285]|uniref:Glycosyl hydrolase family 13 catalytic domain-containing protein n=1 Tax=Stachybotrys chlorohalonatus (strain IBT 40285) TaxID=1283841 RepID=A0A084QZD1_STAC4|nr:hypothetical protein S40285_08521 [Stachybotrys chlorohalonata IBT 40285]